MAVAILFVVLELEFALLLKLLNAAVCIPELVVKISDEAYLLL
jgi:hypothetical protein